MDLSGFLLSILNTAPASAGALVCKLSDQKPDQDHMYAFPPSYPAGYLPGTFVQL